MKTRKPSKAAAALKRREALKAKRARKLAAAAKRRDAMKAKRSKAVAARAAKRLVMKNKHAKAVAAKKARLAKKTARKRAVGSRASVLKGKRVRDEVKCYLVVCRRRKPRRA